MTDSSAQEPTMEEILASIRRIISEDDAPAETAAAPAAEVEQPSPALMDETPSVQEPEHSEEDVLELTETYDAPAEVEAESIGDLEVSADPFQPSESIFAAPEPQAPEPAPSSYDSLVGDSAAASAASAFAGLAASMKKPEPTPAPSRGPDLSFASGSTVEAMVGEMLRPMLKEWLDANLPVIVEAQVRKEVERIARSAG